MAYIPSWVNQMSGLKLSQNPGTNQQYVQMYGANDTGLLQSKYPQATPNQVKALTDPQTAHYAAATRPAPFIGANSMLDPAPDYASYLGAVKPQLTQFQQMMNPNTQHPERNRSPMDWGGGGFRMGPNTMDENKKNLMASLALRGVSFDDAGQPIVTNQNGGNGLEGKPMYFRPTTGGFGGFGGLLGGALLSKAVSLGVGGGIPGLIAGSAASSAVR